MGKALSDASPAARAVFARADEALGEPLSRLCFEGPEESLKLTANTQPAILATSIACLEALRERGAPSFAYAAGHSLGEYSALVAAGALPLADAVRLVRLRGRLMQDAVPAGQGAMAALLGIDRAGLEGLLVAAAAGDVLEAANWNSPEQVVIAGTQAAVMRAVELAKSHGAKRAVVLPVSAPFHCRLMTPAAGRLAPALDAQPFADPSVPVVTNVDARPVTDGAAARDALKRQVASAVRWEESVRHLWEIGVRTFIEVGPGRVLSGLVKRIVPREAVIGNVEDPESLAKVAGMLSGGGGGPLDSAPFDFAQGRRGRQAPALRGGEGR